MKEEPITAAQFEGIDNAERTLTLSKLVVEVHDWLTAADNDPTTPVWEFSSTRSYINEVVKVIRGLDLSRDLLLDATLVLRLAERAVGKAVRRAQAAGELGSLGTNRPQGGKQKLPSTEPYVGSGNVAHCIYKMTDGVTDAQFGAVLKACRTEENLARNYVVRKVLEAKTGRRVDTRKDIVEQSRDIAEQLRKVTVRLRNLVDDDRLARNKVEVAARMRPYLDPAAEVVAELKKSLEIE